MLNNADMKFPTVEDENGEPTELTHGRYLRFMRSRNRDVRRAAFKALYGTYDKQKNTIAALYDASVKKDVFFARARKYESALEHSLDANNIPVKVYDNLVDTVRRNLPLMHRYVRLRRRALGVDELRMYDVYAPIVPDVDFRIPFEAKKTRRGRARTARVRVPVPTAGMNEGWLDVYESVGKASGAYSYGIYGHHPYVLLNHQDDLNSAFTLAHEMGHAMHSFYSSSTQPYVYAHYTIFLAEVAPTVNESLLVNYMLNTGKIGQANVFDQPLLGRVPRHRVPPDHVRRVRAVDPRNGRARGNADACPVEREVLPAERRLPRPRHDRRR